MPEKEPVKMMVIPVPTMFPFGTEIDLDGVKDVWDTFVEPLRDGPPSIELRSLMAILRAVGAGFVEDYFTSRTIGEDGSLYPFRFAEKEDSDV